MPGRILPVTSVTITTKGNYNNWHISTYGGRRSGLTLDLLKAWETEVFDMAIGKMICHIVIYTLYSRVQGPGLCLV